MASDAFPATQSVHEEAPDDEYFPIAQSVHEEDLVTLVAFPAAQLSQELTPPIEKVPAAQSVQEVDAVVPTDLVPVAQVVQLDCAATDVYDPPAQAVHAVAMLDE